MEQVRMPPAQPQAAPKAPAASAPDEASASGDTASPGKEGFARLLAALDGAAALPSPGPESIGVPASPQPDLSRWPVDADGPATDDAVMVSEGLGLPQADAPDALGAARGKRGAPPTADDTKSVVNPAQVLAGGSLQEHLSMLLNQGRHALAGQGLGPDLMINETARIDVAVPTALGAHKGVVGAAGRSLGLSAGVSPQALAAASAAGAEGAATGAVLSSVTKADASLSAPASASGQELLKSMLEKVQGGGDARVSLPGSGVQGSLGAAVQASAPHSSAMGDAAFVSYSTRVASAGDTQAQGGSTTGGGMGMQPPPLQQGHGAADATAGLGPDGSAPGSFMEQLGEQVAFWVHQKSQRAEFTLDRDGQPVQVQLSLMGDVAKITFLTDHAAARQALDAGIEELRASLQEQGLALADVNVGVAGGQGDGGGADQGRGGPARGTGAHGTARVQASEPAPGTRSHGHSDRALDIFV